MSLLFVACGALAREVIAIRDQHGWEAKVLALPALLHNTPDKITGALGDAISRHRDDYERVIVVYGDCGTGGMLDRFLDSIDVERISGPHCYEMYAGTADFDAMMEEQPGTFFLTDYLAGSFDRLVIEELGLDRYPELRDMYFHNYRRIVYLQQHFEPLLVAKAQAAAARLDLPLEIRQVGYGALEERLVALVEKVSQPAR